MHQTNAFLFLMLCTVSIISGIEFLSFDYHMDDAWIIANNYVQGGVFSEQGRSAFLSNLKNGYWEQWQQQRFPGVIPLIRSVSGLLVQNVYIHYFVNLISHGLNAFLMFLVLHQTLNLSRATALITTFFFATGLAVNEAHYAIGIYIGSAGVQVASLLFLLVLLAPYRSEKPLLFRLANISYFVIALSNYSLIVLLPSICILIYVRTRDIAFSLKYFGFLLTPIAFNLLVRSFAPKSSYIGTTPNWDITHIFTNLQSLAFKLLPAENYLSIPIVLFISVSVLFCTWRKRTHITGFIASIGLVFGYIVIYSVSARTSFPNPYFLYIPYIGLVMLLAISINLWPFKKTLACVIFGTMAYSQYVGSLPYREYRANSANHIQSFRSLFKELERKTFSEDESLAIIILENFEYPMAYLGYFDNTINTWREEGNITRYTIATDYINLGDQTRFLTGVNQYDRAYESYRSSEEIRNILAAEHKVKKDVTFKYWRLDAKNVLTKTSPEQIAKRNIQYKSVYGKERYGDKDSTGYFWTDGNFEFIVYHSFNDIGKRAVLHYSVTSLFDDSLEIKVGGVSGVLALKKNQTVRTCSSWEIGSSSTVLQLSSNKAVRPQGDPRRLSFRVNTDAEIQVSGRQDNIDLHLTGYTHSGFHGLERGFRWTKPVATVELNPCLGKVGSLVVGLDGSFVGGEIPSILLNGVIKPTSIDRVSPDHVDYHFLDLNKVAYSLRLQSKRFKPRTSDPRELGFMFKGAQLSYGSSASSAFHLDDGDL